MKLNVLGSKNSSVSLIPSGKQNYLINNYSYLLVVSMTIAANLDNLLWGTYQLSRAYRESSMAKTLNHIIIFSFYSSYRLRIAYSTMFQINIPIFNNPQESPTSNHSSMRFSSFSYPCLKILQQPLLLHFEHLNIAQGIIIISLTLYSITKSNMVTLLSLKTQYLCKVEVTLVDSKSITYQLS